MVLMNLWNIVLELVTFSTFNSIYIKNITLYIMHMLIYCLQIKKHERSMLPGHQQLCPHQILNTDFGLYSLQNCSKWISIMVNHLGSNIL